jgi:hypothetical protein
MSTGAPRRVAEVVLVLVAALGIVYLFAEKSPYHAIGGVVVLFAVLFLMRQPVYLTYALTLLLPVYWLNLLGESLRVTTVLAGIGMAYYLGVMILSRRLPRMNRVMFAYLLFLANGLLSIVNAEYPALSLQLMKHLTITIFILFIFTVSVRTPRQFRTLVLILLGWGVVQAVLGALQTFVSPKFFPAYYFQTFGMPIVDAYSVGDVRRASGTFQVGPRFVMFIMLPLALTVAGFMSGRSLRRRTWALLMIPLIVGVFVSLTRIAVLLSFAYVVLFNYFERRRQALVASLSGLVVVGVLVSTVYLLLIPAGTKEALARRFANEQEDVYMDRFYFLWSALGAFSEHPLLGVGVSNYVSRSWEFMQKYPVPWRNYRWSVADESNLPEVVPVHNEYGRMLAEQGIFSVFIFGFLVWSALRNLRFTYERTRDDFIKTVAAGTWMYLVSMVVYWFFHEYFLEETYIAFLPFALSVVMRQLTEDELARQPDAAAA